MSQTMESFQRPQVLPSLLDVSLDFTYEGSYFDNRGISAETFRTFRLGTVAEASKILPPTIVGAPAMPVYDVMGAFKGWIFRPDHNDYKYFYWSVRPSEHLYGLPFAASSIIEKDEAILVEGPFDVLAAYSHGYKNVVAMLGSCISVPQIVTLASFTNNIKLAGDSDQAGLDGMNRSEDRISKVMPALNVTRMMLYPHKDFCDFAIAESKSSQ